MPWHLGQNPQLSLQVDRRIRIAQAYLRLFWGGVKGGLLVLFVRVVLGWEVGWPVHYDATLPNVFHVPGVPAVVHTQPTVPPGVGTVL